MSSESSRVQLTDVRFNLRIYISNPDSKDIKDRVNKLLGAKVVEAILDVGSDDDYDGAGRKPWVLVACGGPWPGPDKSAVALIQAVRLTNPLLPTPPIDLVNMSDGAIDSLTRLMERGDWCHTVQAGPNPTFFSVDPAPEPPAAAMLLRFMTSRNRDWRNALLKLAFGGSDEVNSLAGDPSKWPCTIAYMALGGRFADGQRISTREELAKANGEDI